MDRVTQYFKFSSATFCISHNFCLVKLHFVSRVSIVSGYGLDDRAIEVRSPAKVKDFFSSLCVRPALVPTHPPVQWAPAVLSPGVKRRRGVTLTTHPHLVQRS
jgi:hypothetical protein